MANFTDTFVAALHKFAIMIAKYFFSISGEISQCNVMIFLVVFLETLRK